MDIVSYGRHADPASPPAHTRSAGGSAGADRIAWADIAKGICIIFVVMMHATLGVGQEMGGEGFMHWVVAFARPFRMPDFFLVSGLFLSRVIDRDWRSYADKRIVHFVYFYILWLVIQSLFKYGQLSGGSPAVFVAHLAHSLIEPFSTLWFIYILAIFSIVTKLLRRAPPMAMLAAAAALQVLPIETPSFLVDEFCERWVYFLAGYMFAGQIFRLAGTAADRPGRAIGGLCSWALLNGVLALTPNPFGSGKMAELPGIGLALGIVGALAIVVLASLLARHKIARPLRYCGQNSIAIYLAFFLPMAAMRQFLINTGLIDDIGLVSLLTTIAAVIVPLVMERLVRDTPLFFLFRRPALFRLRGATSRPRLQPAE